MSPGTPKPLRIAILAHSTNPRGGVVHALELGDALVRLGHEAVVHAPDVTGAGFFRQTHCETVSVPATPAPANLAAMVEQRVEDYVAHFENQAHRHFDVFHAQDGMSANALATLRERGLIGAFARTVHHIDAFEHERMAALQDRAIVSADRHFVVSNLWQKALEDRFGLRAEIVANGVDRSRFKPEEDDRERSLRARYELGEGPTFLAVGGVESRKNTVRIIEAFAQVHAVHADARLIIAGGVSLLDHDVYRRRFEEVFAASKLPISAVIRAGRIADEDMPALYRIADALVFPSVKEGFGLVVLEAMASGVPVVVSRIAPFTEYLEEGDACWCDPADARSIADAMMASLDTKSRKRVIENGLAVARRHDWLDTARRHLPVYEALREMQREVEHA
ncbi:MAG: MSMEG_0565 family glycosyltransferase [Beijerinckiaceae bacterium]|nr:MSMEG_0565 family glycosyltransferase [Beijerinckiaceae bacterium]